VDWIFGVVGSFGFFLKEGESSFVIFYLPACSLRDTVAILSYSFSMPPGNTTGIIKELRLVAAKTVTRRS